jgi:hypothetical protein
MLVIESKAGSKEYKLLRFVEFLELLGRVAYRCMKLTPDEDPKFINYMSQVVDQMLQREGLQRKILELDL